MGVDTRTKKIYAVVITDDKCGDSPQFEELVGQAFANAEKSPNVGTSADAGIAADGAYDTKNIRSYFNPLIPVRIEMHASKEAGFRQLGGFDHIPEHGFADLTREQKRELQKAWRKESGYNDRWAVEIAFSTFKRVLGECMNGRTSRLRYTARCGCTNLIDTAIDNGYGTPRICAS